MSRHQLVLACVALGLVLLLVAGAFDWFEWSFLPPMPARILTHLLGDGLAIEAVLLFAISAPLCAAAADAERAEHVARGARPLELGEGWSTTRRLFLLLGSPLLLFVTISLGLGFAGTLTFLAVAPFVGFWLFARRRMPVALYPDRVVDGRGRVHSLADVRDYVVIRRGARDRRTITFSTGVVGFTDHMLADPSPLLAAIEAHRGVR